MLSLILSVIFLSLASICNAIMDKVTHHFDTSIFSNLKNKVWWNGESSWKNKYIDRDSTKGRVKWTILGFEKNKPVQLTDAWHFFKMWMIIFICLSIVSFYNVEINGNWEWYYSIFSFVGLGVIWNSTFTFFYHKIFNKF